LPVVLLLGVALFSDLEKVFLFVVLGTPLSVNMEQLDLGGIGVALPTEPLMVAMTLLFLLRVSIERGLLHAQVLRHPITLVILAQLVWAAACVLPSEMPMVSLKAVLARTWFVCSMFFLATLFFQRDDRRYHFLWCYMLGLAAVVVYTLVHHAQYAFAHDPAHWVMSPFFKDHTSYGALIAFYLPVLVAFAFMQRSSLTVRLGVWLLLALFCAGLVFSYTRAAWVSLATALAALVVLRGRVPLWAIVSFACMGVGLYAVNQDQITIALERNRDESSDNLAEHVGSISNISSDASNLERINRWKCALRMFQERPVFGWGPGTYMFQYAPFQSAEDRTIISTNFGRLGNAHSEFLGPLAEQGVLGALLMVWLVFTVAHTVWKLQPKLSGSRRSLLLGVFCGLVTYYTHGVLNNFLDLDKAAVPFWGFTAIIVMLDLEQRGVLAKAHGQKGNIVQEC
jgi:putative inorganic carbon (hco3(-)) transporter